MATEVMRNRRCLWKLRPRFHSLAHLIHQVMTNPLNWRCVDCFGGESFVGHMASVVRRCHPDAVFTRAAQRYLLNLAWAYPDPDRITVE